MLIDVDRRWKTVTVRAIIHRPLDHGTTRGALLARMLERGCRRTPDLRSITRHLESLWGAGLEVEPGKIGERQLIHLQLQILSDRYVPRGTGNLARGLEFLARVLAEPVLEDGAFPEAALEQEKENLRRHIEAIANDKAEYAAHRLIQEMCREEPYRRYEWGEVGEIGRIRGRELAAFHARLLRRAPIEIHVAGNVSVRPLLSTLARVFDLRRGGVQVPPACVPGAAPPSPRTVVEEEPEIEQAKLVLGFRSGATLADDRIYSTMMLNGVLGAFSHSRLFHAFRGSEGLAYSIHSWVERTKGLLAVEAGIDADRYEHAVELVRGAVDDLASRPADDAEVDLTRRALEERLDGLRDNPAARLGFYLERAVNGREETLDEVAAKLRAVGPADIVEAARRLQLDTVYFLKPA